MWEKIYKFILSTLTIIALGFAIWGVYISLQASESLQSVNKNVQDTANAIEVMTVNLERLNDRTELVEMMNWWNWITWKLTAENWQDYIKHTQEMAANYKVRYLEPKIDETYILTDKGREIVETKYMQELQDMVRDNKDILENMAIIGLGVDNLQTIASSNGVDIEIIIGVFASYIQEIKQ